LSWDWAIDAMVLPLGRSIPLGDERLKEYAVKSAEP